MGGSVHPVVGEDRSHGEGGECTDEIFPIQGELKIGNERYQEETRKGEAT